MPEGDVLHPFAPQSYLWDDLWLEQDGAAHFVIVAKRYEKEQVAEADRAAVREVCVFFMRMKQHTRLYQQQVDWRNPGPLLAGVLDKANWQAANSALGVHWSWSRLFGVPVRPSGRVESRDRLFLGLE
jgi:hypothetical protein